MTNFNNNLVGRALKYNSVVTREFMDDYIVDCWSRGLDLEQSLGDLALCGYLPSISYVENIWYQWDMNFQHDCEMRERNY